MEKLFWQGWTPLLHTLIGGTLSYFALILFLRTFGKRTLAKMNAFDLVVTVALGSLLATATLSRDLPLVNGLLGILLLILLQYVVTWLTRRSNKVSQLVKSDPQLLIYRGKVLDDAMQDDRVSKRELYQAVRTAGVGRIEDVEAVVLETDGTFSVIKRDQYALAPPAAGDIRNSALTDVHGVHGDNPSGQGEHSDRPPISNSQKSASGA